MELFSRPGEGEEHIGIRTWYLGIRNVLANDISTQQDKPYLQPIIDQIKAEIKEKEALDSMEVVKTH